MKIYLDTNVFDHISKGIGISSDERAVLCSAIRSGTVSIVLSYLNLEEALSAFQQSPNLALAQLQLILKLSEKHRLLKPTSMLLADDIHCYATKKAMPDPFIALDSTIQSNLSQLASAPESFEVPTLIEAVNKQKKDFVGAMKDAGAKVSPSASALRRENNGRPPEWPIYWDRLAEGFAEGFVATHDLELCRKRGIQGLLKVPSVQMAVGSSVSFAYAETFEKRTPKSGDSRDLQHAVLASAAEIFVTHDKALARLLLRIPHVRLQIMELSVLLDQLQEKKSA